MMKNFGLAVFMMIVLCSFTYGLELKGNDTSILSIVGIESLSGTLTITNDGPYDLANINISVSDLVQDSDTIGKGNITFSPKTFNLAANESKTVSVTINPERIIAPGKYTGTITATGNSSSDTLALDVDVPARFDITDLDVVVDGDEDLNLDDGDRIAYTAKPGDEVEFFVTVESLFDSDDDIDIEDIEVEIKIKEVDNDDDLEKTSKNFDLESGDEELVTLTFQIPEDVEEDRDYDVEIYVSGEDDNNIKHKLTWNLLLEVKRKTHEIKFLNADISPAVISCDRKVNFMTEIQNIGASYEEDVVLEIANVHLGQLVKQRDIELDEDLDDDQNTYSKTFSHDFKDATPGTYSINFKLYYAEDILDDIKIRELTIKDCQSSTQQPEEQEEQEEEQQQEDEQDIQEETQQDEEEETIDIPQNRSIRSIAVEPKDEDYNVAIILAYVIVIGMIIVLLAKIIVTIRRNE